MARGPQVAVHFKDIPNDDELKKHFEERCQQLGEEFQETGHFELTLRGVGDGVEAACVVGGTRTHLSSHATGSDNARKAGDDALAKVERELRKDHDKRIFKERRKAQRDQDRRRSD